MVCGWRFCSEGCDGDGAMYPRSLLRCGHPGPGITDNERHLTRLLQALQVCLWRGHGAGTRLSQVFLLPQAPPASISVMYIKHCPACSQQFPSGAWTCPNCGAGPVIESEEQRQRSLSRINITREVGHIWVSCIDCTYRGYRPGQAWLVDASGASVLVPSVLSGSSSRKHRPAVSTSLRQTSGSLNTRGIYDVLMGLVSVCVITTAVAFTVTNVFG